jgi:predicted transport protein
VKFIVSEFTTGDRQQGRIDTLGIDQDGYPTIIEFKRYHKENVINQGLFYLDWLVDHRGDFVLKAQEACGPDIQIDWSHPRLILVAESFTDYDKYAVNRIGANIELWTFRRYGDDLLYLDPLFVAMPGKTKPAKIKVEVEEGEEEREEEVPVYQVADHLKRKSAEIIELFELLRDRIFSLSEEDEILEKPNKMYLSYKHGKNFCEVRLQSNGLRIWLDIPYVELNDPQKLSRDMAKIGHYGTGQVELKLKSKDDIEAVMGLIEQSYQQTL